MAAQRSELATLKKAVERSLQQDKAHQKEAMEQIALRDKKIHEQRKTLVELEALVVRLKERTQQGRLADN